MSCIFGTGQPAGGFFTKKAEPRTPSSSPEKATKTTVRRGGAWEAKARATASMAAVPEALSSAPRWGWPIWSGEAEFSPPNPRWS